MADLQTSAIPLEQIRRNEKQHRKHFDEVKLVELAASVAKLGVLQPIIVRPVDEGKKSKVKYEIVAGERRWRACGQAGLKTIPAIVRELDDKAALEVALVENLRRDDVLPLEEAEGYRELHEVHGESVEQIAEKVGKSKEYVYGRLKLTELKSPAVRQALDAGKVAPSTALLIARIPGEKLQEQAARKILEGGAWDEEAHKQGPMSFRRAEELVQREYLLKLTQAPFNPKDAKLVPEAGACGPCPKRTGNCKELYPDVKGDNVCTDPVCFGKKKDAAFKADAAEAKAEGKKLLKDSPKLWDWEGEKLSYTAKEKYVELTDKCPGDKKGRTFKQLLGAEAKVVLARDKKGKVHELLEISGLNEALEAAGHKFKVEEKEKGRGSGGRVDYEKQQAEEGFRERVVERLLNTAVARIMDGADVDETEVLRLLAKDLGGEGAGWDLAPFWKRRGVQDLEKEVQDAQRPTLLAVVFEGVLLEPLSVVWRDYAPLTKEVCALFGVKLEELEEQQRQADAAAPAKGEEKGAGEKAGQGEDGEGD